MKRKYSRKPKQQLAAGKHQIHHLFELARGSFAEDPELSHRYVALARKIAMKLKLKIDRADQRQFCKHCYSYMMPGVTVRIRNQPGKVVYTCLECGKHMRFPH